MTEAWNKYKEFVRLKKDPSQPVTEFIAEFDKKHKQAKQSGCEFSDTVLGFKLLEAASLSETNKEFVLTAIDFRVGKETKNLLDLVKRSLRKFQLRDRMAGNKDEGQIVFKEEDAFVASVKNALLEDGWKPPKTASGHSSSSSRSVKKNVKKNSSEYKGFKNPLDDEGKPYKCFNCNSEYHMSNKLSLIHI